MPPFFDLESARVLQCTEDDDTMFSLWQTDPSVVGLNGGVIYWYLLAEVAIPRFSRAYGSGLTTYVGLRHLWAQHLEYITGMTREQKVSVVAFLFDTTTHVTKQIDTCEDFKALLIIQRGNPTLVVCAFSMEVFPTTPRLLKLHV